MSKQLRVLHLEDSQPESKLIHRHLMTGGIDCEFMRVDTQVAFEAALESGGFDLILADYALPGFHGPTGLAIARAKNPELPVIFVSGALSEEDAVELVKAGAIDFVRKDRPERLVHAINRALREAGERQERRRAEEALVALNKELDQRVRERTAQLEASSAKLRELAIQLTNAEQRERERLAHVLHDQLQQILVAARMHASVMLDEARGERFQHAIARIEELLRQALETSRSLTLELCPPILFERGVIPALQWVISRAQEKHGLKTELSVCEDAEVDTEVVRVLLFVAMRELLFNIVKHSGVLLAKVTVSKPTPEQVRVTVEDSGKGIDPAAADAAGYENGGFGIFSIRERLRLLGGTLEITGALGRGTRAVVTVPRSVSPELAASPLLLDRKNSAYGKLPAHAQNQW